MFSSFAEMAPCGHPPPSTRTATADSTPRQNWFEVAIAAEYRQAAGILVVDAQKAATLSAVVRPNKATMSDCDLVLAVGQLVKTRLTPAPVSVAHVLSDYGSYRRVDRDAQHLPGGSGDPGGDRPTSGPSSGRVLRRPRVRQQTLEQAQLEVARARCVAAPRSPPRPRLCAHTWSCRYLVLAAATAQQPGTNVNIDPASCGAVSAGCGGRSRAPQRRRTSSGSGRGRSFRRRRRQIRARTSSTPSARRRHGRGKPIR